VVTRSNLSNGEIQESEELITNYEDIFAKKGSDYRQTNRAYNYIDAEEARPIQQPPRETPHGEAGVSGQYAPGHATTWGY
jgi:hypothetical protein